MKKLMLLFTALGLVMTSCSSDDGDSSSSTPVLLTKTIETYEDGSVLTTNYIYDGNRLTGWSFSDGENIVFSYDANGRIISAVNSYTSDGEVYVENYSFEYDSNGRIISIIEDDGYHYDYIYNSDGTITEELYETEGGMTLSNSYKVTITNDNVISEIGVGGYAGEKSQVLEYTYDNKKSPFKDMYSYPIAFYIHYGFDINNNILSGTLTSTDVNNSYTCSYTYNVNDYPETAIENYESEGITTIQYFYNQ